jgi:hypothetical protein
MRFWDLLPSMAVNQDPEKPRVREFSLGDTVADQAGMEKTENRFPFRGKP